MKKDQIELWIDEWTKQHAKGNEQRVLKNFLMMDFAVQPNPKMQPCSNCEQQFMLFMLLPMKQHNMNTYDPDEHRLFCYNCCTEVGQMLHPGRYVPPDQQATERQKALNQNPLAWPWPNVNFEPSQEIAGISHQRGISPHRPTRPYHQTTPSSCTAGTPRHHSGSSYHSPRQVKTQMHPSTLHTTGKSWSTWCGRPGEHTPNRDSRHIAPPHTRACGMLSSSHNRTSPRGKLDHQEFLATQAGTDLWTLEPQQLQRLVKAFTEWEKINFTHMVTGHNNGLLDYINHKDSTAHLQDFLEVVLPNLHQHYICRNTECSFVIKASHWINSTTPTKQGKYLCPRCRTEYRPWAGSAVNNPNKRFCPAAQCLVTKVTAATPPDSDGWAQQLTNHTTSTDTYYLYLMKFPNGQRPAVAQPMQTCSWPSGPCPQPVARSTSSTHGIHQHSVGPCTDAPVFSTACGSTGHHRPSPTSQHHADETATLEVGPPSQLQRPQHRRPGIPLSRMQIWVWSRTHKDPWTCWCTSADCADLLQGLPHQVFAVVFQSPTHISAKHRERPVNMFTQYRFSWPIVPTQSHRSYHTLTLQHLWKTEPWATTAAVTPRVRPF